MSKGKTNIQGIYVVWRAGGTCDALRVIVRPSGASPVVISSKTFPLLKSVNDVIRQKGLRQSAALEDAEVKQFFDRLCQELKQEYALSYYETVEKLELKRKGFDFESSLDEFEAYKSRHSISHSYRRVVEKFWLPFFLGKHNAQHPRDFLELHEEAEYHLRSARTRGGQRYSPAAYNRKTTPFNEYMRFLLKKRVIEQKHFITLDPKLTLEEKKRKRFNPVRSTDTYSKEELLDIKRRIDAYYSHPTDDLKWKLRAYGIFLGSFCLGLRIGNVLGLPAGNLRPNDHIPHAQLKDNVVNGWSRGVKGDLRIEDATKTSHDENIKVPFLLPNISVCRDLACFLMTYIPANEPILQCSTGVPCRWWKEISRKCKFRYIHPHGGKHGFATIGAANLHLFKNNPYLLQFCCLHKDYRTTQKYINQKSDEVLKQFGKIS
jgi:integrase